MIDDSITLGRRHPWRGPTSLKLCFPMSICNFLHWFFAFCLIKIKYINRSLSLQNRVRKKWSGSGIFLDANIPESAVSCPLWHCNQRCTFPCLFHIWRYSCWVKCEMDIEMWSVVSLPSWRKMMGFVMQWCDLLHECDATDMGNTRERRSVSRCHHTMPCRPHLC